VERQALAVKEMLVVLVSLVLNQVQAAEEQVLLVVA
jgi:hypothetical protein